MEAANHRCGWVYEIVGSFREGEHVPSEAMRGAWRIDENGRPTGEFRPNPRFTG
jgi:hypothetical protein